MRRFLVLVPVFAIGGIVIADSRPAANESERESCRQQGDLAVILLITVSWLGRPPRPKFFRLRVSI